MGKYHRALRREFADTAAPPSKVISAAYTRELHAPVHAPTDTALVPRTPAPDVPGAIAKTVALRGISERVAPQAAVDQSVRLLVSGCAPNEGTSTISAALAIDLSQRLNVRTLMVDANLRSPTLHRVFENSSRKRPALLLAGALQVQTTPWPQLDLASCCFDGDDQQRVDAMNELEDLMSTYPAAIVDLGVVRLDARTLPLARVNDPVVLVVRYGHTQRAELTTTVAAMRAANRHVAGVIFNGLVHAPDYFRGRLFKA